MKPRKRFGSLLQTYSPPKASEAIAIGVRLGLLERGDTMLARVWLKRMRVPLEFAITSSEIAGLIEYHHQMCGRS